MVRKLCGRKHIERPAHGWKIIQKSILYVGREVLDRAHVYERYLLALRRENGEEFLGSIKYEEFLDS